MAPSLARQRARVHQDVFCVGAPCGPDMLARPEALAARALALKRQRVELAEMMLRHAVAFDIDTAIAVAGNGGGGGGGGDNGDNGGDSTGAARGL